MSNFSFSAFSSLAAPPYESFDEDKRDGLSPVSFEQQPELVSFRRRRIQKALKVLGQTTEQFERQKALSVLGLTEANWKEGNRLFPLARSRTVATYQPSSPRSPFTPPPGSSSRRRNTLPAVYAARQKAVRVLGMDDIQLRRVKALSVLGVPDFDVDMTESMALGSIGH